MTGRLEGYKALVTGAADGIGLAIARRFREEGARVFATDIQGERLSAAYADAPDVGVAAFDLRTSAAANAMVEMAAGRLGGIDIVVNAAGVRGAYAPVDELSDEAWRDVFAINVDAPFYVCRAAVPHLKKSAAGRIINIASLVGVASQMNLSGYGASKAAVIGLTRALTADLAPFGITSNAILPSLITGTGLTRELSAERQARATSYIPLQRPGTPAEVATAAVFLASAEAGFVDGVAMPLDGGARAVL